MLRLAFGALTLVLFGVLLLLRGAQDDKPKPKPQPGTPAEQYEALVAEVRQFQQDTNKTFRAAKTDADKRKVFEEYETPKTTNFIAQIGPARGAWFKDPDGNVFGLRQGPVPRSA